LAGRGAARTVTHHSALAVRVRHALLTHRARLVADLASRAIERRRARGDGFADTIEAPRVARAVRVRPTLEAPAPVPVAEGPRCCARTAQAAVRRLPARSLFA